MRKIDSDLKYVPWIFGGIALAFPITLIMPLSLPFIIGSGLLFWGLKKINSYKNLRNWKKIEGTLLQTDIGVYHEMDDHSSNGKNEYYLPLTYFSYIWNNSKQKSNTYSFDKKSIWSLNSDEATRKVKYLESLEKLVVYVNPKAPSEAVLNIEISKRRFSHAYAVLISGILICLLGVALVIKV